MELLEPQLKISPSQVDSDIIPTSQAAVIPDRGRFLNMVRFIMDEMTDDLIVILIDENHQRIPGMLRDLFPDITLISFGGTSSNSNITDLDQIIRSRRKGLFSISGRFHEEYASRISQISVNHIVISQVSSDLTDAQTLYNSVRQYIWVRTMNARKYLLKIRGFQYDADDWYADLIDPELILTPFIDFASNYDRRIHEFFDGDLWPIPFSSEVDLITDGTTLRIYDHVPVYSYRDRFEMHVNEYYSMTLGFDRCGDCSIESWIWDRYTNVPEGVKDQVRSLSENVGTLKVPDHGHLYLGDDIRDHIRIERSADEVRQFYDQDREQTAERRRGSNVFDLRSLNNFVKAIIINRYVQRGDSLIDIGGGRGGDLGKFAFPGVSSVVLTDISGLSLDRAQNRYNQLKRRNRRIFDLSLIQSDSSDPSLSERLPRSDIVTYQFGLHYLFDTPERAANTIRTISEALNPGGYLIITIPNAEYIEESVKGGSMGNRLFNIRMISEDSYVFYLEDSVDNIIEHLIRREDLLTLTSENDLTLIYEKSFNELIQKDLNESEKRLLPRMVPNAYSSSKILPISKPQWDVFKLYKVMVFEKDARRRRRPRR